jgi:hypothetical protein
MHTRARLKEALALLLDAGKRSGDLRQDLDTNDVFLALGGFALFLDKQPTRKSSPAASSASSSMAWLPLTLAAGNPGPPLTPDPARWRRPEQLP